MPNNNNITPVVEVMEEGKRVVRPDVVNAVTNLATLAQLVRIRKALEREHIEGRLDEKTLSATAEQKYLDLLWEQPRTPYASASLYNNGPDSVKLSINAVYDWVELAKDGSLELDFVKADRRIETIYYKCDTGKTALVTVKGKY